MDIEQLKMVLESVDNATGAAKSLVIAWLVASFLKLLVHCAAVLLGLWIVGRAVRQAIFASLATTRLVRDLARKHGVEVTDCLGDLRQKKVENLRKKLEL